MRLDGYSLSAINVFQVRTLRALGFHARVVLVNKSDTEPARATSYRVDVSVFDQHGRLAREVANVALLEPSGYVQLDCAQFVDGTGDGDSIVFFHMIPLRLLRDSADGVTTSIDMAELMYLLAAQDHYVEYYDDDGYATGVLYISGAMNIRSNPEKTTMIQAPKVHVGGELTTLMSLMNTSPEHDYTTVAELACRLTDPSGAVVARWTEHIGPFCSALVDLRAKLPADAHGAFYTFFGLSRNASLLPLTMTFDRTHRTLAVEHSLPPTYYGTSVKGAVRSGVVAALASSELFS